MVRRNGIGLSQESLRARSGASQSIVLGKRNSVSTHNEALSIAAMCVSNGEIHFGWMHKTLRLQPTHCADVAKWQTQRT